MIERYDVAVHKMISRNEIELNGLECMLYTGGLGPIHKTTRTPEHL